MREPSWNIYIFLSLLKWLVMAETPKQSSNLNTSARFLCDVFSWETQNLGESVIDLPRLIELTVGKDITSYGCGNSGADCLLYEVPRETYLIRESKEECRRYQCEICSILISVH